MLNKPLHRMHIKKPGKNGLLASRENLFFSFADNRCQRLTALSLPILRQEPGGVDLHNEISFIQRRKK